VTFSAPLWLAAAVAVLALGALGLRFAEARRRRDLERFVAGPLLAALTTSASTRRRLTKAALLLAGVALGAVALARPSVGWRWEQTQHRGTDVLFAVDVSRSMLAEDVKPDRLGRAKLAVIDLLRRLEGDRVGLVAFAGSAFLQSPLTSDQGAFQQSLEALDTDVIPRGGTDVGAALHEAEEAFRSAGGGQKLLVLVTDGEDLEGNAKTAAREAAKQGITVYTVGVGTPAGERIPLAKAGGRGVVLDEGGRPVTSKLDEEGLREIAEATGGFYVPLGVHGEGLDTIYQRVLAEAPKQELSMRSQRLPIERYQWPLGLALALIVSEALLGERRRSRAAATLAPAVRLAAVTSTALLAVLLATRALASPSAAEKAYAAGAYEEALRQYREAAQAAPDDSRLHFNAGAAAYRAGKHDEAAQAFTKALESRDVSLQQRAYYDLGNARFRLFEAAAKSAPEQGRTALEQAVKAYEGALALGPQDEDARFNLDVAKARLEDLKREQEQEKKQKEEQEKDQKQKQKEEQKQEQKQDQQAQQPPPEQGQKQDQQDSQGQQGQPQDQAGGQQQKDEQQKDQQQTAGGPQQSEPQQSGQPQQQNAQSKPGERRAEAEEQAQDQQKPEGMPERADGKAAGAERAEAHGDTRPGEMTAQEAGRLLDSLRGDETEAPRAAARRDGARSDDDEPTRNW